MSDMHIFFWGLFGSIAAEVVRFKRFRGRLPVRYRRGEFYLAMSLQAFVGGGIAIAYESSNPLQALSLGIATPLIISEIARKPHRSNR